MGLRNPYYDLSADIGFSFTAAVDAILTDMQTNPGKAEYTTAELIQVLITAGLITNVGDVSGLGWLIPDIAALLETTET